MKLNSSPSRKISSIFFHLFTGKMCPSNTMKVYRLQRKSEQIFSHLPRNFLVRQTIFRPKLNLELEKLEPRRAGQARLIYNLSHILYNPPHQIVFSYGSNGYQHATFHTSKQSFVRYSQTIVRPCFKDDKALASQRWRWFQWRYLLNFQHSPLLTLHAVGNAILSIPLL